MPSLEQSWKWNMAPKIMFLYKPGALHFHVCWREIHTHSIQFPSLPTHHDSPPSENTCNTTGGHHGTST